MLLFAAYVFGLSGCHSLYLARHDSTGVVAPQCFRRRQINTQNQTTVRRAASATMGYKGIQTSYLPVNTVFTKTVEINGCNETLYR